MWGQIMSSSLNSIMNFTYSFPSNFITCFSMLSRILAAWQDSAFDSSWHWLAIQCPSLVPACSKFPSLPLLQPASYKHPSWTVKNGVCVSNEGLESAAHVKSVWNFCWKLIGSGAWLTQVVGCKYTTRFL